MNNRIKIAFSFILLVMMVNFSVAQETKTSQKKVVIIKKTDENGKITETRKEAEGAEAEELMKSVSPEDIEMIDVKKGKDGQNIIKITKSSSSKTISSDKKGDKTVEITSDVKDGKTIEKYKIVKKDGNGEKVIEWDGEGEMPAELKKDIENININKIFDGENMEVRVDVKGEGDVDKDERVIIVRGDKDKNKRKERMEWINDNDDRFFPERDRRMFNFKADKPNDNKASLGVMIEDTDNGVLITDLVDGSAAAAAGLRRGDVLLKINDKYIFTSNGLIDALHPYNPNEKVKVKYIREGKEKSADAVLKARK